MTNPDIEGWSSFDLYVPGIGKLALATDGKIVRGISTTLMPMEVKLMPCGCPRDQVQMLSPQWDRATAGAKPEWFDDPQGKFKQLREERDQLEGDFVALFRALENLHLQALLSRTDGPSDLPGSASEASEVLEKLRKRPWLPKKKQPEPEPTPEEMP